MSDSELLLRSARGESVADAEDVVQESFFNRKAAEFDSSREQEQ